MIIGITGTNSSGKDTVAAILKEEGFDSFSCSDAIREELKKLDFLESRENLIALGNELRETLGMGIWAKKCLRLIIRYVPNREFGSIPKSEAFSIAQNRRFCGSSKPKVFSYASTKATVSSIRHPVEIEELRKASDFVLLAVDAPPKLRYIRKQAREREGDLSSYEDFLASESKEMGGSGANQQIHKCIGQADYALINDGTEDELKVKVLEILGKIAAKGP